MNTKKILTLITVFVFALTLIAIPASAEAVATFTVDAENAVVNSTLTVKVHANAPTAGFEIKLGYDKETLTYKSSTSYDTEKLTITDNNDGTFKLEFTDLSGADLDTDVATFEFDTPAEGKEGVEFTLEYVVNKKGAIQVYNKKGANYADADLSFSGKTIDIVTVHEAPTFTVAIDGDGVVGQELKANVVDFVDNWGLEADYTYSWTIDDEEVSTEETYTPDADAIGKTVKVEVTATVDAEEEPTATKSAEVEIIADETAQASVKDVKLNPEQPKAGTPVTVEYTFVPSVNGGEDESEIEWYNAAQPKENEEPAELAGKVSEDKKTYTPDAKDYENGVILGVTVTPKGSNDVETGEPVDFEAEEPVAKAKKKSTTSGLNGPSLASGKQESSNNGNGNGSGNNGALDTDKFILTIDQKEASVWGVTKTSDVAPLIKNERTMLPIRFVAENLGFTVGWDEATKTVTITKGDKVITLVIDSDKAIVNDAEVALDSPAYIDVAASRTMVPLRFIAENLDYTVDWIDTLRQVIITK